MNFAVEVPGEATPLSLPELARVLEAVTSGDNAQRQSAGQQLSVWESTPDFFASLQTTFLDKTLPHETRFLAIILLKNGIEKHWRRKNAIREPERQLIRQRLFRGSVDEEHPPFALQNALAVAKVVRTDYPHNWPDALTSLIGIIRTTNVGSQMQLMGALLVLLRIVKELGTARMKTSQTQLQAVTPELVQLLGEIYTEKAAYWIEFLTKGRGDEDDADLAMQNSLTSLKILRRLLLVGYERPHEDSMVQQFWAISQTQFGQFLGYVSHDSPVPAPYQDVVGKHLIQFTKLHIQMAETHPASFAVLPDSLPLVRAYWDLVANFAEVFDKSGGIKITPGEGPAGAKSKMEGPLLERLALRGLLLLRSCIAIVFQPQQSFRYKSQSVKDLEKQAIEIVKNNLLTNDFVLQAVHVIITKLFIFRQSDLEAWEEDPEDWELQERDQGQAWEWEVRPCSERVFLDLLIHYKDILTQPLLAYFDTATKDDSNIVTKEAVYTAMGCAAPTIHQVFDFDSFLTSKLVHDAQLQDPLAKLLRRRIAILISQWVSVKIATANRPLVYEIFRHLMSPAEKINDEVVRITAARQFKLVAEDFEFSGDAFLPFASDIFTHLINLLKEVSSNDETKLAILETIRVIVSRMDTHVSQYGDAIMTVLPELWSSTGTEEYMIKQAVLIITSTLVMSMKGDSQRYQNFMVPLLREAMNPESDLHLHLIEESVELWQSVLTQSSPPLSEDLGTMVALALPLLEYDSQVAKECLEIVRKYILLAPEAMLSDSLRRPVVEALAKTLDDRRRDKVNLGTKCFEMMIQAAEILGGAQGVSVIIQDMGTIGLLNKIVTGLHSAWQASQTVGPNKVPSKISSVVEKDYFVILSRLALADPSMFVTMLASFGHGQAIEPVWNWLSHEWFSSFDYMSDLDHQKLSCLALTRLCELPEPMQGLVLNKLQDYLSMWTSVVTRVWGWSETEDSRVDGLVYGQLESFEYDAPIDVCERELAAKDPVHTIHTFEFVKVRLQDLVQRAGGEQKFEEDWAVNVDKEVLAGFKALSEPRAA